VALEQAIADGAELAYEVSGTGEPVVFIHAEFIADAFRPLLAEATLADRYRLILYHGRGYVGSSRGEGLADVALQARWPGYGTALERRCQGPSPRRLRTRGPRLSASCQGNWTGVSAKRRRGASPSQCSPRSQGVPTRIDTIKPGVAT
jgi:pimeloyl-ACP methyl ester carboxylesterase